MGNLVFDVKRYAIHDGPGIRTTIFFKGCLLSCQWCHNPESISAKQERMFSSQKCIGCGECVVACPKGAIIIDSGTASIDKPLCSGCFKCVEACPTRAMELLGKEYPVETLMEIIEKESIFYEQSGGGVTFSGGEPLLQYQYLSKILDRCGALGIHRTVDTSLFARAEVIETIAKRADLFLVDLKHIDSSKHKRYTGVSNEPILSNIMLLSKLGVPFYIRIPMIDGVNTDRDNILGTIKFLNSLPLPKGANDSSLLGVDIIPYHDSGLGKQLKLGGEICSDGFSSPSEKQLQSILELFRSSGISAKIGG